MAISPILVTGFEPYGGHGRNPSFEAMQALDGRVIEGARIVGRGLPVSMARLRPALAAILNEAEFAAVRKLAEGTVDEVRAGQSLEDSFVQLEGGRNHTEGLEWLRTF